MFSKESMTQITGIIEKNIDKTSDEPFFVLNIEDVIIKHQNWLRLLPRVVPHYAIKANRFPFLLDVMISLGIKFDCASQFEIEEMMGRGVKPEHIIFANPCKSIEAIKCAKKLGIVLMTFDNELELQKISSTYPDARLVLRIKIDDSHSNVKLGLKFGAHLENVESLFRRALELNLKIIGIAFHVGSSCQSVQSYVNAIKISRIVFNMGLDMGFPLTLLDIGGGFPGCDIYYYKNPIQKSTDFESMALSISETLQEYYPEEYLTIIGEPGRYFCESAFTLVTKILAKNTLECNQQKTIAYYLNDGIYGSFSDGLIDKKTFNPLPFVEKESLEQRVVLPTILWGPTCDSADCIRCDFQMPEMFVGEWIQFEDMGAYSLPYCQYGFNGIKAPKVKVFLSEFADKHLKQTNYWPKLHSTLSEYNLADLLLIDSWYQMG